MLLYIHICVSRILLNKNVPPIMNHQKCWILKMDQVLHTNAEPTHNFVDPPLSTSLFKLFQTTETLFDRRKNNRTCLLRVLQRNQSYVPQNNATIHGTIFFYKLIQEKNEEFEWKSDTDLVGKKESSVQERNKIKKELKHCNWEGTKHSTWSC